MSGWTNRGKYRILALLRGTSLPANLYVALCTDSVAPSATTNVLGDLDEIAAGNGYTSGGVQISLNTSDFDTLTEDDILHRGSVSLRDIALTAAGGYLPSDSVGARYVAITDDNATISAREVWWYFDLGYDRIVSDGQLLTLQDLTVRLGE